MTNTTDVSDPRAPTVAVEARALDRPKAPPREARWATNKFKAPARLSQGNALPSTQGTCSRGTAVVKSPNNNDSSNSHALGAPRGPTMNETANGSSNRAPGGISPLLEKPRAVAAPPPSYHHPRPLPSLTLRTGRHSLQQGQQQQQQEPQQALQTGSGAPLASAEGRKRRVPPPLHARSRPFVPPSKAGPRPLAPPAPPPMSSLASQPFPLTLTHMIRARQTGASAAGMTSSTSRTGTDDNSMPPFKLRFGGARNGAGQSLVQQQQQQEQQPNVEEGRVLGGGSLTPSAIEQPRSKEQGDPECSSEGGSRPTRRAWIPNGFGDAVSYRSMFSAAMQVGRCRPACSI